MTAKWAPAKKEFRFISAPRGAHKLGESLPLLSIIRDNLKLAGIAREAKKIIKSREVLVDGKVCSDHRRGIGLFDSVSLPKANSHHRFVGGKLVEVNASDSKQKICKIIGKSAVAGGKIQVALHDGRNLLLEISRISENSASSQKSERFLPKNNYSVGDSLLLEVPEQKISEHFKFETGALVLVTRGANVGRLAHVHKIERGINKKLWLEHGKEKFEAPFDGVIVVGREKPAIDLGGLGE